MSYNDTLKEVLTKFESIIFNEFALSKMIRMGDISVKELMSITGGNQLKRCNQLTIKRALIAGESVPDILRSWIK